MKASAHLLCVGLCASRPRRPLSLLTALGGVGPEVPGSAAQSPVIQVSQRVIGYQRRLDHPPIPAGRHLCAASAHPHGHPFSTQSRRVSLMPAPLPCPGPISETHRAHGAWVLLPPVLCAMSLPSLSWPLPLPSLTWLLSVVKSAVLLLASGSLPVLFPLPATLFPPHPSLPYCLFNCFSAVRFHLMGHSLQEAHPDHPDAVAPPLCLCRSCPWCTTAHLLDPLVSAHLSGHHLARGQNPKSGDLPAFLPQSFLEAEMCSAPFLSRSPGELLPNHPQW